MTHPNRTSMSFVLGLLAVGAVTAGPATASTASNALVRVEVIDHDAGTRTRSSAAVAWSEAAAMHVELAGHAHALSITPHALAAGVAVDFGHTRDGEVLADDLHLDAADRRFVIDDAHTTVVVTVVSVKTSVQSL